MIRRKQSIIFSGLPLIYLHIILCYLLLHIHDSSKTKYNIQWSPFNIFTYYIMLFIITHT
jgi:hypothetical protein